jgi:hypothetical protein
MSNLTLFASAQGVGVVALVVFGVIVVLALLCSGKPSKTPTHGIRRELEELEPRG